MPKTNLTFYLPESLLKKIRIEAVEKGLTLAQLTVGSALVFIEEGAFKPEKPRPENSAKVFIQLAADEKKIIKKAAARHSTTLSHFLYQALLFYFQNKNKVKLPGKLKTPDTRRSRKQGNGSAKSKDSQDTRVLVYYLTPENDGMLRLLSAERNIARSHLILEAVRNVNLNEINAIAPASQKTIRSSMNISGRDLMLLENRARKLGIKNTEYINRAVQAYIRKKGGT